VGIKFEVFERQSFRKPDGWRSATEEEISALKAGDMISVLCEEGIETRRFKGFYESYLYTAKSGSPLRPIRRILRENVVVFDPDRSKIHEHIGYDS
jgi:hypothetical protein